MYYIPAAMVLNGISEQTIMNIFLTIMVPVNLLPKY